MTRISPIFATAFAAAAVTLGASAALAQPFGPPPPDRYCGHFGCPDGWRGMPVRRDHDRPYYARRWHGRQQFWIDGEWRFEGWDAPPPPVRAWRSEGPWRMTRRGNEIDFEMPGDVLFALDSATLSPRAADVIRQIADQAGEHRHARLEVEGYTDTSGDRGHNQQLSDARAGSVAAELARNGIARGRIQTRGFGETHLAVPTPDGVRKAENRRVVVRLID